MAPARKKLYLFHGADEYRVAESAKALVESLVPPADRDFSLEIVDGAVDSASEVERVVRDTVGAVMTPGFLGAGKTVWLRDAAFIAPSRRKGGDGDAGDGGSGGRKGAVERLRALLREIPDGHTLVLSGTAIDARYGGIVADAAKMQKAGEAEVTKFDPPTKWKAAQAAADLVAAESKRRGQPLSAEICRAMVARAGTDSRQLVSELEKLLLYADGAAPTLADVERIVSPMATTEAWDLLDAFGDRRLDKALPILHRLLDAGLHEVMLVILLQGRVNALLLAQDSLARGSYAPERGFSDEVAGVAGDLPDKVSRELTGWQARKVAAQSANYSRLELRRARHVLDAAHERMTSIAMPGELVLELALAEAMRRA